MTQYGFYDNDIMDEEVVCDMIHATSMGGFGTEYNRPWYADSYRGGYEKEDEMYPSLYDRDFY